MLDPGIAGIWWGMPGIWWAIEARPPGNPESGGICPESGREESGIWWRLTRNLVGCSPESGGKWRRKLLNNNMIVNAKIENSKTEKEELLLATVACIRRWPLGSSSSSWRFTGFRRAKPVSAGVVAVGLT